jgi:hypothetical protein
MMQTANARQWYTGVGYGHSSIDVASINYLASVELPGPFFDDYSIVTSVDDEDTGYKVFAGVKFHKYLRAEFGYADFGENSVTYNAFNNAETNGEVSSYYLALTGNIPLNKTIGITGRTGLHRWRLDEMWGIEYELTQSGTGQTLTQTVVDFSEEGNDIFYGVGLKLAWLEIFYETYEMDDNSVDFTGLSATYEF